MKRVFTGKVIFEKENSGMALVSEAISESEDLDLGMFVRIQSWDCTLEHVDAKLFENKEVRVTVELV